MAQQVYSTSQSTLSSSATAFHTYESREQQRTNTTASAAPIYPPSHFTHILENVKNRNNFLNLGLESASSHQAFFELYHEFQGKIVGIDVNPEHVRAVQERASTLLPTQALTRTKLISGDVFSLESQIKNKKQFDLVSLGSEVHNVATADRLFDLIKHNLLARDGTLAILSLQPESITFQNEEFSEKTNISEDFKEFSESIEEYGDLSANPLYNEGVQTRHFSNVKLIQDKVDSIITPESLLKQIRASYAFTQYMNDPTQSNKSALTVFQRRLQGNIAARQALNQNHLIRVSHKILTYILRR